MAPVEAKVSPPELNIRGILFYCSYCTLYIPALDSSQTKLALG